MSLEEMSPEEMSLEEMSPKRKNVTEFIAVGDSYFILCALFFML